MDLLQRLTARKKRLSRGSIPGLLSLIKRTLKMEGGFYGRIKKESDRKIRK